MSRLLEILGRAITVDTADLIWHWLNEIELPKDGGDSAQCRCIGKIIELIAAKKLQTAEEELRLYLFENPDCIYGRMAAAAICIHKNQLQNAIHELDSIYMRQPSNTMALYALGYCYERLRKETQAVEFYQDCLKFKNYLQLPRQRLAAIYFKNGQIEKTIQEYELLKSEYPDDISTLVTLGYLYIANGRFDLAVEEFNTAILVHPDDFYTNQEDIDQLIIEGHFYEAKQQLEDLLQNQADRADLILKYADVLCMLGLTEEAVLQYQKALHICPDFLEAAIKLGTQLLHFHADKFAAKQFNRAAEINDNIVDAYIGLAIAENAAGNLSDGLTTLSLAAAIQPNTSVLFAETAALQFKTGLEKHLQPSNYDDTVDLMEAVISAHRQQIGHRPQNPDLHYRLGVLMMGIGRLSEAVRSFQAVLEINPTYTRARHKLSICLFETGQEEDAMEQLTSGPDCLDTGTLELHYKVALLYCDRIKFASSLMNLVNLLEENFTCPDATVNISIVLQNLGLLDRATAMWDNLSDTTNQAISTSFPFATDQF
ncbi:MAG: tetratricopeptide repeat protein [Planctomycetota bacterium]|jgi:tetratricopeptide (TPR) repeat protein